MPEDTQRLWIQRLHGLMPLLYANDRIEHRIMIWLALQLPASRFAVGYGCINVGIGTPVNSQSLLRCPSLNQSKCVNRSGSDVCFRVYSSDSGSRWHGERCFAFPCVPPSGVKQQQFDRITVLSAFNDFSRRLSASVTQQLRPDFAM